jgi:hypothetical protein
MGDVTEEKAEGVEPVRRRCRSYDPMAPGNVEARKYDDTSSGIDWDEIILTTQDDFEAGRFSYNSADYATKEEADAAFTAWLDRVFEEAERERENETVSPRDASSR